MLAHLLRAAAFIAASCVRARRHGHVDQARAVTREVGLELGCELRGIFDSRPVDAEAAGERDEVDRGLCQVEMWDRPISVARWVERSVAAEPDV
jgi:hypothetical protein